MTEEQKNRVDDAKNTAEQAKPEQAATTPATPQADRPAQGSQPGVDQERAQNRPPAPQGSRPVRSAQTAECTWQWAAQWLASAVASATPAPGRAGAGPSAAAAGPAGFPAEHGLVALQAGAVGQSPANPVAWA